MSQFGLHHFELGIHIVRSEEQRAESDVVIVKPEPGCRPGVSSNTLPTEPLATPVFGVLTAESDVLSGILRVSKTGYAFEIAANSVLKFGEVGTHVEPGRHRTVGCTSSIGKA
jgi:hypothetical protein